MDKKLKLGKLLDTFPNTNKYLCIKVYPPGGFEFKPLLERHVIVDQNLIFPYEKIIDSLHILFGDTCIITFNRF